MPELLATQNQAFCETSLETRHLRHTADRTEDTLAQIFDDTLKLFYFTSKDQGNVVLGKFELYDKALIENLNYA